MTSDEFKSIIASSMTVDEAILKNSDGAHLITKTGEMTKIADTFNLDQVAKAYGRFLGIEVPQTNFGKMNFSHFNIKF